MTQAQVIFAGRVDPRILPRPARGARDRRRIPFLTPGGAPPPGAVPRATVIDPSSGGPPPAASLSASFDGLDSADNAVALHPPDPQIAVGPNHVLEMVNVSGRIFNRSGAELATFTLASFFAVPACTDADFDPKVIYDGISGRFFAAYVSFCDLTGPATNDTGRLNIASSTTSNPLDPWNVYFLEMPADFPDYPAVGLTSDKLTISFNRFQVNFPNPYKGAQTLVLEKADLVAGAASPRAALSAANTSLFTVRPAHSLTAVNTQFMASVDNGSSSVLHLFAVTGTPAGGDVAITNVANPLIQTLSNPPNAQQPGTAGLIATNDNRLLETVWRNGRLWASANAACTLPGDSATRSCLKLIEVDTNTNAVVQDIVYGSPGEYFFYPAIRTDNNGNLFTVFTASSSTRFAEVRIAGRASTEVAEKMCGSRLVKAGEIAYAGFAGERRWGDYSGAALDPASTSTVWFVGEYAKNDGFVNWGTFLGSANLDSICPAVEISLLTDGSVAFGIQALTVTVDTTAGGLNDVQTVQVVKGPADVYIKTTAFSDAAASTWSLGSANGPNQVVWEFSSNGGVSYTKFSTAGALIPLQLGAPQGATRNIHLRLTMPTTATSKNQHSATVTIVAVKPP